MMQIRCLPSCQNFEPPNVPSKQNPRCLRKTSSIGRAMRRGRGGLLVNSHWLLGKRMKQPLLQWGVPASRILRDTSSLVAALSKRQAHKEIQNHKFETRNSKRGKFQGSSLQFQEKTEDFETEEARSEAASSKEQRVRQECRTSLARSASSSAIHDPPRLSHSCSFACIRGLNISARVGAAGPHRPTGKRDKTSRSKIQEKKPDLHLSLRCSPHNP